MKRRVLLVGWDSADWRLLRPLMDRGLMPALSGLVARGVHGNLASLDPLLSPIIWTSIATGKFPHKHGVLGFVEPDPAGEGVRPVGSATRRTAAIWNMLSRTGRKAHVSGWFASHPAEEISGIGVSERFHLPAGPDPAAAWPLAAGTVSPASLAEAFAGLRVHPREIEGDQLLPFVPAAASLDQSDPQVAARLSELAAILAETATHQAVATEILAGHEWDFLGVYFRALDSLGHHFMPYHPPLLPGIDPAEAAVWGGVMETACVFHDLMLRRLLELAGPETTVILLSDHGFHHDDHRPGTVADESATMAGWHRPFGIFAMAGPGIRQGEKLYGSSVLDVTPTLLHLFGLPVGADMDGKVLLSAFETPTAIERIPSWDEADRGSPHAGTSADESDRLVLDQLVALGYMEAPDREDVAVAAREIDLNRIASRVQAGDLATAESEARALAARHPEDRRCALKLVQILLWRGRLAAAGEALDAIEQREGTSPVSLRMRANLVLLEGRPEVALELLRQAVASGGDSPDLHEQLGRVHLRRRRWQEAEAAFRRALAGEPDLPVSWCGLASALVRQDRDAQALDAVLTALGLQHHSAQAHFQLGAILSKMAHFEDAVRAFETGLKIQPGHPMALRYLTRLYRRTGDVAGMLKLELERRELSEPLPVAG